jgi:hypothetical protein
MKKKKYERLAMDSELRARALQVVEAYNTGKSAKVEGPVAEKWNYEVVPAMMKSMSRFIVAYDNNELSPTLQRKLFKIMKVIVASYPV